MSRGDGRALRAVAGALYRRDRGPRDSFESYLEEYVAEAELAVTTFLDALLSELPGELHSKAFTAAENAHWKEHKRLGFVNSGRLAETAIRAFLLSLRSSSRGANR